MTRLHEWIASIGRGNDRRNACLMRGIFKPVEDSLGRGSSSDISSELVPKYANIIYMILFVEKNQLVKRQFL